LRPRLFGYALALAVAIVAVVSYGWAGFWLGVGLLVLTRLMVWALPLVKLSYTDNSKNSRAGG
jgi:hypothetical protein